jgi:hypothetical protein
MKWGTKYGPEYTNRLASMVKRNLTLPYRFICLTDDPTGLDAHIETRPLPAFIKIEGPDRAWPKISVFQKELFDIKGRTLFLDVDVVLTGNIDALFTYPGEFLIIRDWITKMPIGNSSVFRFEAGAHSGLLDNFLANYVNIQKEVRNEQEYISKELYAANKLDYWPEEWCVSFKYHCMYRCPLNLLYPPEPPPETARIVVFHGHPNPIDAVEGNTRHWTRHVHPTPWVAELWK